VIATSRSLSRCEKAPGAAFGLTRAAAESEQQFVTTITIVYSSDSGAPIRHRMAAIVVTRVIAHS